MKSDLCTYLAIIRALYTLTTLETVFSFLLTFLPTIITFQQLKVFTKSSIKKREHTFYKLRKDLTFWMKLHWSLFLTSDIRGLITLNGPRQANLVLIAYASSEGSGEPAHPRSLARTFAARSYKQWIKMNLQTESQIPGPSEWLDMCSWNLSWRNARRHKFAWRGSNVRLLTFSSCILFQG